MTDQDQRTSGIIKPERLQAFKHLIKKNAYWSFEIEGSRNSDLRYIIFLLHPTRILGFHTLPDRFSHEMSVTYPIPISPGFDLMLKDVATEADHSSTAILK